MIFLYVDECGDSGNFNEGISQNSRHYIISGLTISDGNWQRAFTNLKKLRKSFKSKYNLLLKTEIHASELIRISKIKEYREITKQNRLNILKEYSEVIPEIFSESKIINICFDKSEYQSKRNIQITAWSRLIQRFDTYLNKTRLGNGIIVSDFLNNEKLIRSLLREMRVYNIIPSLYGQPYNSPITKILEDVFIRQSEHSLFIQTVDVIAQLLYRREYPKTSLKKYNLDIMFNNLKTILLLEASKNDDFGIVRK